MYRINVRQIFFYFITAPAGLVPGTSGFQTQVEFWFSESQKQPSVVLPPVAASLWFQFSSYQ